MGWARKGERRNEERAWKKEAREKGEKAGNEKKKKVEQIEKFRNITSVLKSKCFCKRDVPTLKQIKGYLKKEKKLDNNILNQINDANVIEKWNTFNNWN